jgi:hypothetical protein
MRGLLRLLILLAATPAGAQLIAGGGESIVHGGTGGNSPIPVKTVFGFNIQKNGDQVTGTFDCLALAPHAATGPGSGEFTDNVMYVTGTVTAVQAVDKTSATFSGTANVTGIGAGLNLPFNCEVKAAPAQTAVKPGGVGVTAGGAGAHMTLVVSGLTFDESITTGGISISPLPKKKK